MIFHNKSITATSLNDSVPDRELPDRELPDNVFLENEWSTNRKIGHVILAFSFSPVLYTVMNYFDPSKSLMLLTRMVMWPLGIFLALSVLIARLRNYQECWVKYVFLGELLLFCNVVFFFFSLYAGFAFLIPIFISVQYFDRKTVTLNAIIMIVSLCLTCILGLIMDRHSELVAQLHKWSAYDPWKTPIDAIMYILIPMLFITLFMVHYSFGISKNGRKLINAKAELNAASEIQSLTLPEGEFRCSDGSFSVSATVIPAKEVGGDFYDYFMPDSHTLVVLIADVSDKGLSAAMFVMSAKKAIRCAIECCHNLEDATALANRLICEENKSGMFLTLWMAMIDTRSGIGKYINAGHLPPLIRHKDGTVEKLENDPDLFLGTFPDMNPGINLFRMVEGDTLLLYTDGVTDSMNAAGDSFGAERLMQLAKETRSDELRNTVINTVMGFSKKKTQFDDITVMTLQCESLNKPETADMLVSADRAGTEQLMEAMNKLLEVSDLPEDVRRNADVILDEICSNICENAYTDETCETAEKTIGLHIEICGNSAVLSVSDNGAAFDPLGHDDPDLSGEPGIGGLGIYFVKNLADNVAYRREEEKNILTVTVLWNL